MKLYVYDHCPYCVKARMVFGLKKIPFELITLLNDDEKTPMDLIGQKMVPILHVENMNPMPESLDIVRYADKLEIYGPKIFKPSRAHEGLNTWLKEIRNYHYKLAMPRWVKMGLDEFKTQSAIDYFTFKKEQSIGPFVKNLEETPKLIRMAHDHLQVLESMIVGGDYFWGECTEDDLHVFASLRCLTTTQGLRFPEKINTYMNQMSVNSGIPLHWERAV